MGILPVKKTKIKTDLRDYITLIYGPPKVGKTSFAAEFPDAVFFATEEGQSAHEVMSVQIGTWKQFKSACSELAEGEHNFKTVVIDTIDNLWLLARLELIESKGLQHENDGVYGYGKGSSIIMREFQTVLKKLSSLPYGLVMISHSQKDTVNIKPRSGTEYSYNKFTPSLKEDVYNMLCGMSDILLFAENGEGKMSRSIIHTLPSQAYIAGSRVPLNDPLELDFNVFKNDFDRAVSELVKSKSKK